MNFHVVPTPRIIDFAEERNTLDELTVYLNSELSNNGCWTDACTTKLSSNPKAMFLFDRFEFILQRAYGLLDCKIALNPMMILCCHPHCIKKPIYRLKHIFDINDYVKHHMSRHTDLIGKAIRLRYAAVADDPFLSLEDLNHLSPSPYLLNATEIIFEGNLFEKVQGFGITRPLFGNYVSHWKSKMFEWELIDPTLLTFQEDEALLYSILHYPNPVRNWSTWPTICFYCLKLYSSQSAGALALHRGLTKTRLCDIEDQDVKLFTCSINHAGPSLSTLSHSFPLLNYKPQVYHKEEQLFQIEILEKNPQGVKIGFEKVVRYMVTLGADDQDLNRGTFINNSKLYGLKRPMSATDIQKIGLKNLPKYIATENNFLTGVREYRASDFGGLCSANIFTSHEAGSMDTEECMQALEAVMKMIRKCRHCIENNRECGYTKLDEQCQSCKDNDIVCVSLVPFHVLWDMAGTQRGTGTSEQMSSSLINSTSSTSDFMDATKFTLSFGGLHICKALINPARNCVLTYNGENYGIHVLRAYKTHESLIHKKNAVFIGKDRQSDELSHSTCANDVQEALKVIKNYHVVRVPEPIMRHHENCKTQKPFSHPVSIACNKNGDVFVLDCGVPCIHVVDRTIISKVLLIGKYGLSDYSSAQKQTAANLMITNSVRDIVILEDILYTADPLRGEVIILRNVSKATMVRSSPLFTLSIQRCSSIAAVGNDLVVLLKNEDGDSSTIKVLRHDEFPKTQKKKTDKFSVSLEYRTMATVSFSTTIISLFSVTISSNHFGGWASDKKVFLYKVKKKKINESETASCLTSSIKPSYGKSGLLTLNNDGVAVISLLELVGRDISLCEMNHPTTLMAPENVVSHHQWGSIVYWIRKAATNRYQLEESGPLNFGVEFSSAIALFYDAISYTPRNSRRNHQVKLTDSIELSSSAVKLFSKMQDAKEDLYPTRKTFVHADGMPWSKTIKCLVDTVDSWKALLKRLEFLEPNLPSKVDPHTITNESVLEHSFGSTKTRGQGNSQNPQEYTQTKRLRCVDFHLKMCKMPFNQHCLSRKEEEKSYQSIEERSLKISFKEIQKLFQKAGENSVSPDEEDAVLNDEQTTLLKNAYALSKSVPRQSGRNRWREKAGFNPNMLTEEAPVGVLLMGDLLSYSNIDDSIEHYIVQKDFDLLDVDKKVEVMKVGSRKRKHVTVDKFLTQNGLIFTVPESMYSIYDGIVTFSDDRISQFIENLRDLNNCGDDTEEGTLTTEIHFVTESVHREHKTSPAPSSTTSLKRELAENSEIPSKRRDVDIDLRNRGDQVRLMRGDCVKIIAGAEAGGYGMITGGYGETAGLFEVNYFEIKYGKYVLKESAIAQREGCHLLRVEFTFDNRSRYTFEE